MTDRKPSALEARLAGIVAQSAVAAAVAAVIEAQRLAVDPRLNQATTSTAPATDVEPADPHTMLDTLANLGPAPVWKTSATTVGKPVAKPEPNGR
jgi:hypothetical protein